MTDTNKTEGFINRWSKASGSERSNCQLFVTELCALLDLPQPDPASDDTRENAYVFERRVTFAHGDESRSDGYIDCYRRATFVLEAKKVKGGRQGEILTQGFDDALRKSGPAETLVARQSDAGTGVGAGLEGGAEAASATPHCGQ